MNIQIRKAFVQDINEIENIESKLEHRILSYDILSSTLDKDNYYYFIAETDNKVIGYIAAELLVDHFDLLAIAVLEEYTRHHVATSLLSKLETSASELNICDIFLEVRCSNFTAIRFYEKKEFEKISTRKNYYSDTNEDAYIYKKMV